MGTKINSYNVVAFFIGKAKIFTQFFVKLLSKQFFLKKLSF